MTIVELLNKTADITEIDYFCDDEMTEEDRLACALQDLLIAYRDKQMELDDFKDNVEDNYRPLTLAEQIGAAAYRGY